MKIDTLIIGQGLAGSLLAWKLLERGQRVLVVDKDEPETSSKVAAGLLTPISGSRFNFPEGLTERLSAAKQMYWEVEEKTGRRVFHHTRIARLFRNGVEKGNFEKKREASPEEWESFQDTLTIDSEKFHVPYGGFEMKEGGWLDVPAFLEATRQHLLERIGYAIASVDLGEIIVGSELGEASGVRWKRIEADRVILAQGWQGNQNRFFDWVPMNSAAGDILELEIPDLEEETRIVNRGGWLLPLGFGRFRAGSTYRHDFGDGGPSAEGRQEVLTKLEDISSCEHRVTSHRTAIRPIIRRSQVFMGTHPDFPEVSFFNGLGSKGVLNGPWHASQLVAHLLDGEEIPSHCDLRSLLRNSS